MSFGGYDRYVERKPHYLKMIVWRLFNAVVFPLLPRKMRDVALRMFGAVIGQGGIIYRTAKIYAPWLLEVGDRTVIGPRTELYNKAKITIGNYVVVSQDVYLCTASHDVNSRSMSLIVKPITLDDASWVAAKVTILPGVRMLEGAVAGAASVVTKDVPAWTVVGGNPARFIKKRELKE